MSYTQEITNELINYEGLKANSKILSSKHFRYDKASKINPKSFMSMFLSICNRYDISVWYCNKKDSARLFHDLLFVYAREYLKNI